jgi:hypothetical protein
LDDPQFLGKCDSLGWPLKDALTYAQMSAKYNFTQAHIANSTRIVFPIGEFDPTSAACGPEPFNEVGSEEYLDSMASRMLIVAEGAHAEDGHVPYDGAKPGGALAQLKELRLIKGWLAGAGEGR